MTEEITKEEKEQRDFLLGKTDKDPETGKTLAELKAEHDKLANKALDAEKRKEEEMKALRLKKAEQANAKLEQAKLAKAEKKADPVKNDSKTSEGKSDAKT